MSEINWFISGHPRTGTAWLSNVMSYGQENFSFHECERDLLNADPADQQDIVMRRLAEKPHFAAGNVSSGMLTWTLLPSDGPLVIIVRDQDEMESSLRMAMVEWGMRNFPINFKYLKEVHDEFVENHPHAKIVLFENLFHLDTIIDIWKHCVPMLMPPVDRFKECLRHRVTLKEFDYPRIPTHT